MIISHGGTVAVAAGSHPQADFQMIISHGGTVAAGHAILKQTSK